MNTVDISKGVLFINVPRYCNESNDPLNYLVQVGGDQPLFASPALKMLI